MLCSADTLPAVTEEAIGTQYIFSPSFCWNPTPLTAYVDSPALIVFGGEIVNMSTHNSNKNQMIMSSTTFRKEEFCSRIRKGRHWWLQGSKLFSNSASLLVTPKFLKVLGNTKPTESTLCLLVHVPWLLPIKTWISGVYEGRRNIVL